MERCNISYTSGRRAKVRKASSSAGVKEIYRFGLFFVATTATTVPLASTRGVGGIECGDTQYRNACPGWCDIDQSTFHGTNDTPWHFSRRYMIGCFLQLDHLLINEFGFVRNGRVRIHGTLCHSIHGGGVGIVLVIVIVVIVGQCR